MNIVLTGGGTAGHIMPNLALLPELAKSFANIYYFAGDGMEQDIVPQYGIPFAKTQVVKLNRNDIMENFKIPFVMISAVKEAKQLLDTALPDVVFSKGGYASLPVCFAAKSMKIPVVIHESDLTMGVANKMVARFAKAVLTGFPESDFGEFVGSPVREELFEGNGAKIKSLYGFDKRPVLLAFGGSLGARALNDVVFSSLGELTKRYNVLHIKGKDENRSVTASGYASVAYTNDIADFYAASDIILCRGGANSLAEITALGKRALCVPLPKGASRGDQLDNAASYKKRGLIEVVPQSALNTDLLLNTLELMLKAPPPASSKTRANKAIADKLVEVASRKKI